MKQLLQFQIQQVKTEITNCSNINKIMGLKEKLTELQIKLEFMDTHGENAIIRGSKSIGVACGVYSYDMEEERKELETSGAGQFSVKRLRYNIELAILNMGKTGMDKLNAITSYKENAEMYNSIVGFKAWDINYRPSAVSSPMPIPVPMPTAKAMPLPMPKSL